LEYSVHSHDVIIIGGGLAGLRAAVEIARAGCDVGLLSKVHPLRSHSGAAQGGINAALGNADGGQDDSWDKHAFDTVKGSDYLADQDAVEVMCREAPGVVIELEHMGTVFSRTADGKIAQRPFGGAGFPRTCYAADRTGRNLLHTLYEQLTASRVTFYDEYFVTSLAVDDGRAAGCVALKMADGSLHGFKARATLLATGGFGRLFARSTNALINTGDGAALAFRAGAPLEDMEFVQFHPTTLYGSNILITEGARGEGGLLYNNRHERFMKDYAAKAMELAPRDIVARAIQTEAREGRGFENEYVHLDLTHLGAGRITERLPGIRQIAIDFAGVDPVKDSIPVQPGQHYSMGGVASCADGSTPMPGLYAAGECACVSVHGANRLGGNSLLETVVFGKLSGAAIAAGLGSSGAGGGAGDGNRMEALKAALARDRERIDALLARDRGERMMEIREELRSTMTDHFGVFREEGSMKDGLAGVRSLKKRLPEVCIDHKGPVFNYALIYALELEGMLGIAEALALGALKRRESRGAHARSDYTERDDENFLVHTMAYLRDGEVVLEYAPVTLGKFPVKERTY
jgi:succinate dehydrogenase / fumarate reductase flavoprotein subunit